MAQFKPKEISSSKLDTTKVVTGQMILSSDTGDLYFDSAVNGRIHVSNIVELDLDVYNALSDDDKLAFCKKYKNCLFINTGSNLIYGYSNGSEILELYTFINTFINEFTTNTDIVLIPDFHPNTDYLKVYLNGILMINDVDYSVHESISSSDYYIEFDNTIIASEDEPAYILIEIYRNMGYTSYIENRPE